MQDFLLVERKRIDELIGRLYSSVGEAVYDAAVIHDDDGTNFFARPRPAWATVDGSASGTIVSCSVRPQHQVCRTWVGTAAGRPVAVVTDLGLLGIDLAENPARPWRRGAA